MKDVEQIYKTIFEEERNISGSYSEAALSALANLALFLQRQKCHSRAGRLFRALYKAEVIVFGPSYEQTLSTLQHWGESMHGKKYADVEAALRKAYKG